MQLPGVERHVPGPVRQLAGHRRPAVVVASSSPRAACPLLNLPALVLLPWSRFTLQGIRNWIDRQAIISTVIDEE